ncbi:PREDICTED: beta-1,4 N-acetylgalactosaminyltransferase 2-like [Gekko japonicus]|uniref:Beta-1,4 N-acetylgalactosaminyltransferase 2-like n=1 Tax=Gekko japonicus TaxID=146911 RepID=A0ABM1JTB0_GEKJA|nr:PREDICTED: beta-1,4 N-acetylgalactosaminyltransferase 2-like [Gekko japonicus]
MEAHLLLKDLIAPQLTKAESYSSLVKALTNHLAPKPTKFMERMDFFVKVQGPDETASNFLAALRRATTRCSFSDQAEALLNQFLVGLREPKLRRRLIIQDDLDIDKAIREATAYEKSHHDCRATVGSDASDEVLQVCHRPSQRLHEPSSNSGKASSATSAPCASCREDHERRSCRFRNAVCRTCKGPGSTAPKDSARRLQPTRPRQTSSSISTPSRPTSSSTWLGPKNRCECAQTKMTVYQMADYIAKDQIASITERREKEFEEYQRRYPTRTKDAIIAAPNTPLSYPIYGAEVMPWHTIVIPGLGFHGKSTEKVQVVLRASLGTLNTLADTSKDVVHGRGGKELTISTSNVKLLNHILGHVTYTSTVFLVNAVDMVSFETGSYLVKFPVTIRQLPLPKLFDPGSDNNIRDLVTITTKTFLRYHKLRVLLKSIRQFYPDIKVIVADDSEHPEKIEEANVEHFIMPFGKGWFAGRNLAVSQVTTKYYLWVDDDCLFTKNTKIEKLVEVLENTNLDVV